MQGCPGNGRAQGVCVVCRGCKNRGGRAQASLPVSDLVRGRSGRAPAALPAGDVGKLDGRFGQSRAAALRTGGIELCDLLKDNPNGPAIDDDMVENEEQDVIAATQPKQARAKQWRACDIEGR